MKKLVIFYDGEVLKDNIINLLGRIIPNCKKIVASKKEVTEAEYCESSCINVQELVDNSAYAINSIIDLSNIGQAAVRMLHILTHQDEDKLSFTTITKALNTLKTYEETPISRTAKKISGMKEEYRSILIGLFEHWKTLNLNI